MKAAFRTTIIFEDKHRLMLKTLSLEMNLSQKAVMVNALEQEYHKWRMTKTKDEQHPPSLWDNKLAFAVIKELEPIIKYTSAKDFFLEYCEDFGIVPRLFSYDDFSMNFINLLCKNLLKLCATKNVRSFKRKMISLKRRKRF